MIQTVMGDHDAKTALVRLLELKQRGGSRLAHDVRGELARNYGQRLSLSETRSLLGRCHFSHDDPPPLRRQPSPAVTVVVPVYGTEAYLSDCLEGLLQQTLNELQIIVVDDASPDRSNDIILAYLRRDRRFHFVHNGTNEGLLRARASGVRFAQGRYIAHLDSDDFVAPRTYAAAFGLAETTGADLVQFGMQRLKQGKFLPHDAAHPCHQELFGEGILRAFLRSEINFSVCNKLYSRTLWRRAEEEFPRRSFKVEDLAQNAILMRLARYYVSLPEPFHTYRITPASDSRAHDLENLKNRAVSSVRHVARLKQALRAEKALTRLWPDLGRLEHRVYEDYVRPLCGAFAQLPEGSRKRRGSVRLAIRRIARMNGWLALQPWLANQSWLAIPARKPAAGRRPAVSLIIPVYNQAGHLGGALTSALGQSLKDLEIIVVDDGSSDASPEIISRFAQRSSRLRVLRHRKNQGLLLARLAGARLARGRYIAHLDSDDMLHPAALETLLKVARRRDADIVQCGYAELTQRTERKVLCREIAPVTGPDIFARFLKLDGISNAMWNKLYRRELYERAMPLLPDSNQLAEDFCQNTLLMALAGRLEHIGEPLYRYTVRPDSGDRDMDARRVCTRALSACFNLQQARYVAAIARRPEQFTPGLAAREQSYFTRMMQALHDLPEAHEPLAAATLADCHRLTGHPLEAPVRMEPAVACMATDLSNIDGVCERIEGGRARGWVLDRCDYSLRVGIDIYWDGLLIGSDPATNHRRDLERVGWGDGRHGFAIALPDITDDRSHELSIHVAGTNVSLRKCPAVLRNKTVESGPNRMGGRTKPLLRELLRRKANR